jgi:predicted DCC family thiol-disulfide oxidoreductase YuxK
VRALAGPEHSARSGVALRLLFDGACPLCCREVSFLRRRDERLHPGAPRLAFTDINAADYEPAAHAGIDYRQAMGRIHAITHEGVVITDLEVFHRAYALVGLGWLYAPTSLPVLGTIADGLYGLWARWRLRLTGRPDLESLCRERCRLPG